MLILSSLRKFLNCINCRGCPSEFVVMYWKRMGGHNVGEREAMA